MGGADGVHIKRSPGSLLFFPLSLQLAFFSVQRVVFFFFLRFYFFLFLPKAPQYIVVYSSLWVLLVAACGTLPQRGLMSSAMSAPRI